MIDQVRRFWLLLDTYAFGPITGRVTTATFWYSPDPPQILDQSSFETYRSCSTSPLYLIDYTSRVEFPIENSDGIVVLPYGGDIGLQVNPEAAFQFALGLHDKWRKQQDEHSRERFLHYAYYFLNNQTAEGDWHYEFDWLLSKAPWTSALAQSRGASVMLRAYMITGEAAFREAARRSVSKFTLSVDKGGYLANFSGNGLPYFEEYPLHQNATLNGFIAALFGLWEISVWLKDQSASDSFSMGLHSLEKMLPYYTISWWTLYDFVPEERLPNPHSPRYHKMCTGYLETLAIISKRPTVQEYAIRWKRMDRLKNRMMAYAFKAIRKIAYR